MVFVMVAEQRRTSGYGSCGGVLADALSRGAKASPHLRSSGDEGAGQDNVIQDPGGRLCQEQLVHKEAEAPYGPVERCPCVILTSVDLCWWGAEHGGVPL